jgi:hypothetical protein
MSDTYKLTGMLRIYEVPEELWLVRWWKYVRKKGWKYLTLEEKAREGKLVVEAHNIVTSAGRTQILSFIGSSGSTTAFAQYYAVGTGAIYTVSPADASLAGELFRAVPGSFSVVGNSVTITTLFSTAQGNGTYTNSGLWGNGATSTPGSGTLMTHLLYSYTKTSSNAIYNDYTITAV